jgi:hypothetical protein
VPVRAGDQPLPDQLARDVLTDTDTSGHASTRMDVEILRLLLIVFSDAAGVKLRGQLPPTRSTRRSPSRRQERCHVGVGDSQTAEYLILSDRSTSHPFIELA